MKKMMEFVAFVLVAVMVFTGCGKSDGVVPNGTYVHNGNTLEFSGNKVTITEGGVSTACDYTSDREGRLVIDPDGEKIPADYDAKEDIVTIYNIKYRRKGTTAENREGSSVSETASVPKPEESLEPEGYNKDMFGQHLSITEDGAMLLCLSDPKHGAYENKGYIAKFESYKKAPEEFIEVYQELSASGNEVTVTTEDGRERVWIFDEGEGTLSSEGDCFYLFSKRKEYIFGKIAASENKALEGNYVGVYEGSWDVAHGSLKSATRAVSFQFHADHKLESMLDEDFHFIYGNYWIDGGNFYIYSESDPWLEYAGTYDEASDTIAFMGMELKRAEGE